MPKLKKRGLPPFYWGLFILLPVFLLALVAKFRKPSFSCCSEPLFLEDFEYDLVTAVYEGEEMNIPLWVFEDKLNLSNMPVLGSTTDERWIEVDLSEQKLTAWDGSNMFLETLVSTGMPWWPTPQGEFRIWAKARATKMEGGEGRYYYYLPNVPFVMFFENSKVAGWRGYGLHGTYWHDDFGTVHSHGCVNLPTPIAEQLYYWTTPTVAEGRFFARTSANVLGTRIIIHE